MKTPDCFESSTLSVLVWDLPHHSVSRWTGKAPDGAAGAAEAASSALLAREAERVVLDLGGLGEVSDPVGAILARLVVQAQRLGRNVVLVRCAEELFRTLQQAGVRVGVAHAASLMSATGGVAGDGEKLLELHLRSAPELLPRLRVVIAALASSAGLPRGEELKIKTAVTEAAANAIVHGSPAGARNHVAVSFHLDPMRLIIDIADQGPGFDPAAAPPPSALELREHGFGLHLIRQLMDRVEFYRDERGMLVRMTKNLDPGFGRCA